MELQMGVEVLAEELNLVNLFSAGKKLPEIIKGTKLKRSKYFLFAKQTMVKYGANSNAHLVAIFFRNNLVK
jgi:hypothetical protein